MKRTILLLAVLAAACAPQGPGTVSPESLDSAAATITPADVRARIAFLASDALRGRDTPSPGLDSAAAWIAREMDAAGLQPAGEEEWLQRYPYPSEALDPARTELAASAGATHSFEYGTDFFAWRGAPVPESVGLVYAVPGTRFDGGELRDRGLLVPLHGLPVPGRRGFRFAGETAETVERVRAAAGEAGAAAVVFLLDERLTPGEVAALAEAAERPERRVGLVAEDQRPLPTFFLTRGAAARMLRMADLEEDLLDPEPPAESGGGTARERGPGSRGTIGRLIAPVPLPGVTLRLAAPSQTLDDARPPNVVGLLPGSDTALQGQYVVLSAHMDHVGVGRPDETGDSIYNGADDDASGVSVLLEVAEAMARLEPPRRSILFLAVSGEEKGLLGSRWFTENPTVPLDSVVANLNLDMVGRNATDSIVVIGQEYSSLGRTVHRVADRHRDQLRLTVSEDLWPEQRFFFRSDHFNFARNEIPSLFFFAGTHEDYHRPGDEVEDVDTDKTARVGRLVFYLTRDLADAEERPAWTPDGLETIRRLTRR